ncbi:MAG: undecaprenyl-diphosphate phosphatase [archaeon]
MLIELAKAAVLGVVEGVTEFLPISSTGHLLVVSGLLNFPEGKAARDSFDIFIQLGAVLAVLLYYRKDFFGKGAGALWRNLALSFLPVGIVGFLFGSAIKSALFSPLVVATSLFCGGIVLFLVDDGKRSGRKVRLSPRDFLAIGFFQVFALVPGVSRSAAVIVGCLLLGLSRRDSAKYSFLLAVPTLGIATVYELFSAFRSRVFSAADFPALSVGFAFSLIFAAIAVKFLIGFVSSSKNPFRAFAIYRVVAGISLLALVLSGFL